MGFKVRTHTHTKEGIFFFHYIVIGGVHDEKHNNLDNAEYRNSSIVIKN
jgi:hypothetical protein